MSSTARLQHGWVAIDRQVWEHPAFADEAFSEREAWFWLISHAEYRTDAKVPRGCLVTSYQQLADAWHWSSRGKARHYMERLERDGMVVLMRGCVRIAKYDDYQSGYEVNQGAAHNVRTNRAQVNETKSEACEAVAHNVRTNSAQNGFPPPTPPSYKETTNKSNQPPTPTGDAAEEEGQSNVIPAPLLARPVVWQAGVLEVRFRVSPGPEQKGELKACGLRWSAEERCWLGVPTDLPRLQRLLPGAGLTEPKPVAEQPPPKAHRPRPASSILPLWALVQREALRILGSQNYPSYLDTVAAVDHGTGGVELISDDEVASILFGKNLQALIEQVAERVTGRQVPVWMTFDPARYSELSLQRTGGDP
jgi:hypothetical protein